MSLCPKCNGKMKKVESDNIYATYKCENCGRTIRTCAGKTTVYSRVVGFFTPVENWNDGKKQEFKERKHFNINSI